MPPMIPLGWFHTIMAIIALLAGAYTLARFKVIDTKNSSGILYLVATLITAVTALMIYQRGTFGPGHALAVLTLGALAVGMIAAKTNLVGKYSRYLQAISFTGTLLFHFIPAITDGLLRLPVGDPVLDSLESPVLKGFYLAFFVTYLIGVSLQIRWLSNQPAT